MEVQFLFFWFFVAVLRAELPELWLDKSSLRVRNSHSASLQCCYKSTENTELKVTWIKNVMISRNTTAFHQVNIKDERVKSDKIDKINHVKCSRLELLYVTPNDTGLYQCLITEKDVTVHSPGTFLQVYLPMNKTLNISEQAKNSIITAEGVLLLLCVLIPGTTLLCKTKGLNNLNKTKAKEEENIYEGLNLDECNSTYHQLQHCQSQGPYQDVMSTMGDDTLLEKP